MSYKNSKIRLYLDGSITKEQEILFNKDQSHYLYKVMRLKIGDTLDIFNGCDGAWKVEIIEIGKKITRGIVHEQTQIQFNPPDIWLLFAPIKKNRTSLIIEKATEMGAARIIPVKTDFTNAERIKRANLHAHAVEAAEQCKGTFIPIVEKLTNLNNILDNWPKDRHILYCDETLSGTKVEKPNKPFSKWAILVGPEGGFSSEEQALLNNHKQTFPISLGPRILRADTAVVAALSFWQNNFGDW
jgi:16S rRNA (uracil1498-N3)-methyltransferase